MSEPQTFVIYDTEFWTDEGCLQRRWRGLQDLPPILIQFGAFKVSMEQGFPVFKEINMTVKPTSLGKELKITPFFEELTAITQERVDQEGVSMQKAFETIEAFIGNDKCLSYGSDVLATLLPSAFLNDISLNIKANQFYDFRHVLHRAGWSEEKIADNSSGSVAKTLGLDVNYAGNVHDAAFDAHSLLISLRHLVDQDQLSLDQIFV